MLILAGAHMICNVSGVKQSLRLGGCVSTDSKAVN